jgi:sarcosine oxidase subunit gamma
VVWLGPDEWLLIGEHPGDQWAEALRAVVAPLGGAAVDVSDQRTGVRLRGSGARELLAFGCALDLRPASFPPGSCAQTLLGQAGVLLIADRVDDGFVILVRTSFAGYVADWLLDAAQELRPTHQATDQQRAEA